MSARPFQLLGSLVLGLWLLLPALQGEPATPEGVITKREMIQVGTESRAYTISYPKDLGNKDRYPLIVAFHGYRGDVKTWFYEESAFTPLMAKEPFIIVYPEGPIGWASRGTSRDLRFFDALVDELKKKYPVDPTRIYVVGHSNGAVFASFLLLARPEIIAAAVAHSGLYDAADFSGTVVKAPLMVIWGEKDPMNIAASDAVQLLIESYRQKGIPVETFFIPEWGHPWAGPQFHIEEKVLAFLLAHQNAFVATRSVPFVR